MLGHHVKKEKKLNDSPTIQQKMRLPQYNISAEGYDFRLMFMCLNLRKLYLGFFQHYDVKCIHISICKGCFKTHMSKT